jgi:hypothetical protein
VFQSEPGTSHRWQHLLGASPPYVLVMERWHSVGRKFDVLDFGRSVLLYDAYIPSCVDWATVTVDVWNRTDKGKNGPPI